MKQIHTEGKQLSLTNVVLPQPALHVAIIVMIGMSSLSFAANPGQTKSQPIHKTGEIDTAAATALVIVAYREIQGAMIEADFQKDVRASAVSSDREVAADLARMAVKRREIRLQKLAGHLTNMETAYNTWANIEKEQSPRPLDMASAATHLREIATSSTVSDRDPHEKKLVAAILHPKASKSEAMLSLASIPRYSPLAARIANATTVAQLIEVRQSSLSILAVVAIIVIHRISQLTGASEGVRTHGLLRRA